MTREQKLEAWAERELKRNIDSIIVDDGSGALVVFGKYVLKQTTIDSVLVHGIKKYTVLAVKKQP